MTPSSIAASAQPTTIPAYDPAKAEAFVGKAFGDLSAAIVAFNVALGDRHGLLKDLASCGPQTAAELAECTGTNERYVREWASCLTAAGYLTHDAATDKFALPPEHAAVLAEEGGPFFLAGFFQVGAAVIKQYEGVAKAFREGGGVAAERFDHDLWEGEARSNAIWHNHRLFQVWLPALPEVHRKLTAGASLLDVGCGEGRVLVNLAKAYPRARFVGLDVLPASIEKARALAKAEGVADRVTFQVQDLTKGIPGQHDVVTAFDVVHDVQDPPKLLRDARKALKPGGRMVIVELNTADDLAGNAGPVGAALYGISSFYCMTISLSRGGAGYGTAGLPEKRLRGLAKEAGFAAVQRLDAGDPLQVLYELS